MQDAHRTQQKNSTQIIKNTSTLCAKPPSSDMLAQQLSCAEAVEDSLEQEALSYGCCYKGKRLAFRSVRLLHSAQTLVTATIPWFML